MARILIAGCGFVGQALCRLLVAEDEYVWGVNRKPQELPPGVTPIALDLSQTLDASALPKNLTHICFAAAPSTHSEEHYRDTYLSITKNLLALAALHRATFKRFLFVSSTAVYSQQDGSIVTESSPASPNYFSGKIMLEAEKLLTASGLAHCILRCSGIYGPGRTRLLESVTAGTASYDPANPTFTNRIHRDDVAGALAFLLRRPSVPPLLVGSDPAPVTHQEVMQWLAKALAASPPRASSEKRIRGGNKRCSSQLLRSLGYEFRYPSYKEGYSEMLAASPASKGCTPPSDSETA